MNKSIKSFVVAFIISLIPMSVAFVFYISNQQFWAGWFSGMSFSILVQLYFEWSGYIKQKEV